MTKENIKTVENDMIGKIARWYDKSMERVYSGIIQKEITDIYFEGDKPYWITQDEVKVYQVVVLARGGERLMNPFVDTIYSSYEDFSVLSSEDILALVDMPINTEYKIINLGSKNYY